MKKVSFALLIALFSNLNAFEVLEVDKGIFAFPTDHAFGSGKRKVKSSPEVVKASKKKTLKRRGETPRHPNEFIKK